CGLCVLAPSGTSLADSGNGLLTVGGSGVVVDSAGNPALAVTGSGGISAPAVNVVGTASLSGQGKVANLHTGAQPVSDPLAGLNLALPPRPATVPSVAMTGGSRTIPPGVYQNISLSGQASLTLTPGTYVIVGGFAATAQAQVTGKGVLVYLACSSYPTPC